MVRGVLKLATAVSALALMAVLALGVASPGLAFAAGRPVVTKVSPGYGPIVGGNTVTIRGKHFRAHGHSVVTRVTFAGRAAKKLVVHSATRLTVRAPQGTGTAAVRVTTTAGTSARVPADRYSYGAPKPKVTGLSPTAGPKLGGTAVTITGSRFTGVTAVSFGEHPAASFSFKSDTTIQATTPLGTGTHIDVTVTTLAGTSVTSAADQFSYYASPVVKGISPAVGPAVGGTKVTITGSVLFAATKVRFGAISVPVTKRISNNQIVATAPAGTGKVEVTVTTPGGTSATSPGDRYTYAVPAAANSVVNQSGTVGTLVGAAPSVIVTDGQGHGVAGVSVIFVVAPGGGSVTAPTVTTDASGVASVGWTLGTAVGPNTLTATAAGIGGSPVTFSATGVAGPAMKIAAKSGNGQSATVGTAVSIAPSVVVTDGYGNPDSGVSVAFAASGDGTVSPLEVTTDAFGIATVDSWTLGTSVGSNTLKATAAGLTGSPVTFSATGTVGAAKNIDANSVLTQSASVGTAVGTPPSVVVTDAHGNPVAGVSVGFAVASGGGSVTAPTVTTNSSGVASVGWTLGTTAGSNALTATAAGLTGSPVTFSATGTVGAAKNIDANSVLTQSAAVGTSVGTPPSVVVTDAHGNPVSGVSVAFVASGDGTVSPLEVTTDAFGIATVDSWTLGTTAGSNALTATAAGLTGSPVTFSATGTVGLATTIAANVGDDQSAPAGMAVSIAPSVIVTDTYGNPVAGVSITFAASGDGTATPAEVTTDVSGIAAVDSWTLDSTPGSNTLTATSDGLDGSPATFTATGVT